MVDALVCQECGAIHNPDNYDGLKCRRCGGKLVLGIFFEKEEKT